jgi:rhomboid protease GluP
VYPARRVELPQTRPVFTYILIAINVIVFLIDYVPGLNLTEAGAKSNFYIVQGEYWRFITPMFLHAGTVHLIVNCYSLYNVGPSIERAFGYFRFLAIYFLAGLTASIASFAFNAHDAVGASGALFGIVGAFLPFFYRNRTVLADTNRRIMGILQVIALNLFIGFIIPVIDNWAHIGGLLAGIALAWATTPRYAVRRTLTGEVELIDDETSFAQSVVWFGAAGLILIGFAYMLIQIGAS